MSMDAGARWMFAKLVTDESITITELAYLYHRPESEQEWQRIQREQDWPAREVMVAELLKRNRELPSD